MSESVKLAIGETKVNIDGRVTLPAYMRKEIGIVPGDTVHIQLKNGMISIWNGDRRCAICADDLDADPLLNELGICRNCMREALREEVNAHHEDLPT